MAASAEHYRALGYEYMVTEATNQWTGAAFEAVGGVRVHFYPFQVQPAVRKSDEPLESLTTSPNGFLSDKDSGGMFYVLRLAQKKVVLAFSTLGRRRINRACTAVTSFS